jgi:hypothetical protein
LENGVKRSIVEEIEDLRIEAVARARLVTSREDYVSARMMAVFVNGLRDV